MKPKINHGKFKSLDDSELIRACLEPVIKQIRGKNFDIKSDTYAQLNAGQRALLMFWVFYSHAQNGLAQFFGEVGYLLDNPGVFSEFTRAMEYFKDPDMQEIMAGMEDIYAAAKGGKCDTQEDTARLEEEYRKSAPFSLKLAANYIRDNPFIFVEIED
jgi:hypothetical protein